MLHSLEHVRDHQNPLADTPTLVSCQAPQLGRPRFAAEKVCRHPPSPKHSTLAYQLYHIWGSPEAGITGADRRLPCRYSRQPAEQVEEPVGRHRRPALAQEHIARSCLLLPSHRRRVRISTPLSGCTLSSGPLRRITCIGPLQGQSAQRNATSSLTCKPCRKARKIMVAPLCPHRPERGLHRIAVRLPSLLGSPTASQQSIPAPFHRGPASR